MSHELYEVLGVSQKATHDEIKKAYREAVLRWHPDRNKSPDAEERFKAISFAYETLGDPEKRKLYDLTVELPNGTSINPDEVARLFTAVFGSYMDEKIPIFKKYAKMYEKMQEERLVKRKKQHKKTENKRLILEQGKRKIRLSRRK